MNISDPGQQYEFLNVDVDGQKLQVLKRNRAIQFDAYWATEPVAEEQKPDMRMSWSDIPHELKSAFTEEERLTAFWAEEQRENAKLRRQLRDLRISLLIAAVFVVNVVWIFIYTHYFKH